MKNLFKIIGIIAPSALIVFALTTCHTISGGSLYDLNRPIGGRAPVITITTQPAATTTVQAGKINSSLSVAAVVTDGATLYHQWYSNTENKNTGSLFIQGENDASFSIPSDLTAGTYYYFCEIDAAGGAATVRSIAAMVTVTNDPVITIEIQPAPKTTVTFENISNNLIVEASVSDGTLPIYQWYSNTSESTIGGTKIDEGDCANFTIPTDLAVGTYDYFCKVSAIGATTVQSKIATVRVKASLADMEQQKGNKTFYNEENNFRVVRTE